MWAFHTAKSMLPIQLLIGGVWSGGNQGKPGWAQFLNNVKAAGFITWKTQEPHFIWRRGLNSFLGDLSSPDLYIWALLYLSLLLI